MTDLTSPLSPSRKAQLAEAAWHLAATRMPKLSRVIFRLKSRGWSYARIQRRLGISRWRLLRAMFEAIHHIDRAFRDIERSG